MEIKLNPKWSLAPPADIKLNSDGSVTFKGPVGDVFLPRDYLDFLRFSDGLGTKDEDAWFIARFPDGPVILEIEWLGDLDNVMHGAWRYLDNDDHGRPLVPTGYVYLGKSFPHHLDTVKAEFDVILCCIKDHHDFGKVFVWPRSDDPWMEGENTIGLGFVANSFTEFINNLTARENL